MEITTQFPVDERVGTISIDDGQLGQLAYHIRWSALSLEEDTR